MQETRQSSNDTYGNNLVRTNMSKLKKQDFESLEREPMD